MKQNEFKNEWEELMESSKTYYDEYKENPKEFLRKQAFYLLSDTSDPIEVLNLLMKIDDQYC